jgi:hypothetical protein
MLVLVSQTSKINGKLLTCLCYLFASLIIFLDEFLRDLCDLLLQIYQAEFRRDIAASYCMFRLMF